jgi:hypothetical protein
MNESTIELTGDTPKIEELIGELTKATDDASGYCQKMQLAYDARHALWPGQSSDGRKHAKALGRDAKPWEGSSDVRIRTVDRICNEQSELLFSAFLRAKINAVALTSEDLKWGTKVTTLLQWEVWTKMRTQLHRELSILSNWMLLYGSAILGVFWRQETRRVQEDVTLEMIAGALLPTIGEDPQLAVDMMSAVREMLLDPERQEELNAILQALSPTATRKELKQCREALLKGEKATLPVVEPFNVGPEWRALLPFVDIFFPVHTDDIQTARWVAHRERLTVSELKNRVVTHGYDEDWVEEASEKKGQAVDRMNGFLFSGCNTAVDEDRDFIEIFHFYYKSYGKGDDPVTWHTVLHPHVQDAVGLHEEHPYKHGLYPYVVYRREYKDRDILSSQGIGVLAHTWQNAIKLQHDARSDRSTFSVLPPIIVPAGRSTDLEIGPGTIWPGKRNENFQWMSAPSHDPTSIEIENSTTAMVDQYFGCPGPHTPPEISQRRTQSLADNFLVDCSVAVTQTLQLMQQYLDDEVVTQVIGQGQIWRFSRQEIQGQFHLQLDFDTRNLNPEMVAEKMKQISELILPLDRLGIVDTSQIVEIALSAIDPWMAQRAIRTPQAANEEQITDEQNILARMVSGIESPMTPQMGMNYELRLQILQQTISSNPELQSMIEQRPMLQKMLVNRMKFLQFQVQQQQNAVIGRVGTAPVLPDQPQ